MSGVSRIDLDQWDRALAIELAAVRPPVTTTTTNPVSSTSQPTGDSGSGGDESAVYECWGVYVRWLRSRGDNESAADVAAAIRALRRAGGDSEQQQQVVDWRLQALFNESLLEYANMHIKPVLTVLFRDGDSTSQQPSRSSSFVKILREMEMRVRLIQARLDVLMDAMKIRDTDGSWRQHMLSPIATALPPALAKVLRNFLNQGFAVFLRITRDSSFRDLRVMKHRGEKKQPSSSHDPRFSIKRRKTILNELRHHLAPDKYSHSTENVREQEWIPEEQSMQTDEESRGRLALTSVPPFSWPRLSSGSFEQSGAPAPPPPPSAPHNDHRHHRQHREQYKHDMDIFICRLLEPLPFALDDSIADLSLSDPSTIRGPHREDVPSNSSKIVSQKEEEEETGEEAHGNGGDGDEEQPWFTATDALLATNGENDVDDPNDLDQNEDHDDDDMLPGENNPPYVKMDLDHQEHNVSNTPASSSPMPIRSESIFRSFCPQLRTWCHRLHLVEAAIRMFDAISSSDHLVQPILSEILESSIHRAIEADCRDNFAEDKLSSWCSWVDHVGLHWLSFTGRAMSNMAGKDKITETSMLKICKSRLLDLVHQHLGALRIQELFDIIVDYPNSKTALENLKTSKKISHLKKNIRRTQPTTVFINSTGGANTADIITQYISTVQALRHLDPTGIALQIVGEPIRKYLRTREDTVRCIVLALTDESNIELQQELAMRSASHGSLSTSSASAIHPEEDVEDYNLEEWHPAPLEVALEGVSFSRVVDLVSLLVNVYDAQDVFVTEFQKLLADRLLALKGYSVESDLKNIELLKLTFGESSLQFCEVMLKDITDSKRIDTFVQNAKLHEKVPLHGLILSRLFWPPFKKEAMEIPPFLKGWMDDYEQSFEKLKVSRKLEWLPQLGSVDMEISLSDRTLTIQATPAQAMTLHWFEQQEKWTLKDLEVASKTSGAVLRRRLQFWLAQNVIEETEKDVFCVLEYVDAKKSTGKDAASGALIDEPESAMVSAQESREQEMRVYWSFIVGMLTNLGTLPIERIQMMLGMFVQAPAKYDRSIDDLRAFLSLMIREDKLEMVAGAYKLKKP